ncbi:MAG: hypothetical protein AB7U82_13505 [Blastocatellales bacterium]
MMNIWRRGLLTQNPYYRTPFRIARVPREITRHRTIVKLIGDTRQLVNRDPQSHRINGSPVTDAEINAAEPALTDPKRRIIEELLEHAAEEPPLGPVRKLAQEVAEAMAVDSPERPSETWMVNDLGALQGLATSLIRQFLEQAPQHSPSFGALELEIVPPFGRADEV